MTGQRALFARQSGGPAPRTPRDISEQKMNGDGTVRVEEATP
jgi:hypothetical protein